MTSAPDEKDVIPAFNRFLGSVHQAAVGAKIREIAAEFEAAPASFTGGQVSQILRAYANEVDPRAGFREDDLLPTL